MAPLMSMPHREKERLQMIETALRDKAPTTYRDLKREGELRTFVADQERMLMENFKEAQRALKDKILNHLEKYEDPIRQNQAYNMEELQAWHESLETFLEFADPEPTTE